MPRLRRLLPALLLLAVAPCAGAQPTDSTGVRPVFSHVEAPDTGGRSGCRVIAGAAAGATPGGGCVPSDPAEGSMPLEAVVGVMVGDWEGLLHASLEVPLLIERIGGLNIAFVSAEAVVGGGTGLRGGAGLYGGFVLAASQDLRLAARGGGWAERSPMGSAYGPLVEGSARFRFVRVEGGAVVAGAPVHYGRVVVEAPLRFSEVETGPYLGVGLEVRRYADTGTFAWTLGFTLGS